MFEMHQSFANVSEFKAELERLFAKVVPAKESAPAREFPKGEYVEFFDATKYRPGDERYAVEQTLERLCKRVWAYLSDKSPSMTLVWRVEPEEEDKETYFVKSYDENGPDLDYVTDKRCYADRNWRRYAAYARFAVVP